MGVSASRGPRIPSRAPRRPGRGLTRRDRTFTARRACADARSLPAPIRGRGALLRGTPRRRRRAPRLGGARPAVRGGRRERAWCSPRRARAPAARTRARSRSPAARSTRASTATPRDAALREAEEEIGLAPARGRRGRRARASAERRRTVRDRPVRRPDRRPVPHARAGAARGRPRVRRRALRAARAPTCYHEERWEQCWVDARARPLLRARRRDGLGRDRADPRVDARAPRRAVRPTSGRRMCPKTRSPDGLVAAAAVRSQLPEEVRGGSRDRHRQVRSAGLRVRRHRDRPQSAHARSRRRRHLVGARRVPVRPAGHRRRDGRRDVARASRSQMGNLGGLGCLNLEGIWTRYDDPDVAARGDRRAPAREGHASDAGDLHRADQAKSSSVSASARSRTPASSPARRSRRSASSSTRSTCSTPSSTSS